MDENNMNNLNNGVDEEDEATTVLVAPGVGAAQPSKPEAKADGNWGAAQSSQSNDYGNNQFGGQQANGYGQNQFGGQQASGYGQNQFGGNNQFGGQQANGYGQNQFGGNNQFGGQQASGYGQNQFGGNNQFGGQQMNGYTPNQFGGQTPSDIKPGKKISKKMLAIIGGAAAVVIIALVLIFTLGGSGAKSIEDLTDKVAAAYADDDWEALYDLYYDDYLDAVVEEAYDNEAECKDEFKEYVFDYYMDDVKDEVGKVKDIEVTDIDKENYSKSEVNDFNDDCEEDFGENFKFDKVVYVRADVDVTGKDDTLEGVIRYTAVKKGNRWYLVDDDSSIYVYED